MSASEGRRPGREGATGDAGGEIPVSVVVASCRNRSLLTECLEELVPQCREVGAELLVARPASLGDLEYVKDEYSSVRVEAAPADSDVPLLRGIGARAARGDIVAMTEDHCVPAPGWLKAHVDGHEEGEGVVGGPMDNARRSRIRDWGAFFAEYGFFAGRHHPDDPSLTGANVSYGREIVDRVAAAALAGEWENVIHERLAASGTSLRLQPDAVVLHNRSWEALAFCADRFRHGRDYARRRLRGAHAANARWIRLASTPLLPALLASRIARDLPADHRWPFFATLPITLLFLAAWSIGEATGYLQGPAEAEHSRGG